MGANVGGLFCASLVTTFIRLHRRRGCFLSARGRQLFIVCAGHPEFMRLRSLPSLNVHFSINWILQRPWVCKTAQTRDVCVRQRVDIHEWDGHGGTSVLCSAWVWHLYVCVCSWFSNGVRDFDHKLQTAADGAFCSQQIWKARLWHLPSPAETLSMYFWPIVQNTHAYTCLFCFFPGTVRHLGWSRAFARCFTALWQFLPCNTALMGGWWHSWQGGERGVGVGIDKRRIRRKKSNMTYSCPFQCDSGAHEPFIVAPTVAVVPGGQPHPTSLVWDTWMYGGPYTLSLRPIQLFNRSNSFSGGTKPRLSPHFKSPFLDFCGRTWQQRHDKFKACSLCCAVMLYFSSSISRQSVYLFHLWFDFYFLSVPCTVIAHDGNRKYVFLLSIVSLTLSLAI